jgi:hypothetical protein
MNRATRRSAQTDSALLFLLLSRLYAMNTRAAVSGGEIMMKTVGVADSVNANTISIRCSAGESSLPFGAGEVLLGANDHAVTDDGDAPERAMFRSFEFCAAEGHISQQDVEFLRRSIGRITGYADSVK